MREIEYFDIKVRSDGYVWNEKSGWHKGSCSRDASGNLIYYVLYTNNGIKKMAIVSRLVCHLFIGLDLNDKKTLALHKNRRSSTSCDNSVDNLYIGTQSENMKDKIKDKTCHFSDFRSRTSKVNAYNGMATIIQSDELKDGEFYFRQPLDRDVSCSYFDKLGAADFKRVFILMSSLDMYGRIMYGYSLNQNCKTYTDIGSIVGLNGRQLSRFMKNIKDGNIVRFLKQGEKTTVFINPKIAPNGVIVTPMTLGLWKEVIG
ncbi:MAG: hypothetical protein ACRC0G_08645 [Fusobacteriaceae bacterium]